MPTPHQLPLKVLFKGPSTLVWTSMMSGPRSDMVFPRVMEAELLAGGRSVDVWNAARNGWLTRDLFATWEEEISSWSPDVIIMTPVHMECIHALLPPWLERGANAVNRRPTLWSKLFYRKFLRGLARMVLHIQKRIDGPGRFQGRVKRGLRDTDGYLRITKQVGSPLVILLEVHTITRARKAWFPGFQARADLLNDGLRQLAERHENVEYMRVVDLMEQFDPGEPEDLWADGVHFSPPFHRVLGERLADRVEQWARTQSYLDQP